MSRAIHAIYFPLLCSYIVGAFSKGFFLNSDAFNSANVPQTSKKLESLMQISCLKDRILITFSRKEMLQLAILPGHVYLEDNQCSFQSNETHYLAKILFRSVTCGSRHTRDRNSNTNVIDNAVRFIPPAFLSTEASDDEDDDFALRFGSGDGGIADQLNLIKIPFECEYTQEGSTSITTPIYTSTEQQPEAGIKLPMRTRLADELREVGSSSFVIDVYDKNTFINPLRSPFFSVPEGELLFVQVKPISDSIYEKSFLHNCYYYSELEIAENSGIMYLIKNGCPVDPTVEYLDDYQGGGERLFQFRVKRFFKRWTMLRCEVQPCTVGWRHASLLPECGSQMAYCSSKPYSNTNLIHVAWPYTMRIVEGSPTLAQDQMTPSQARLNGCPEQSVEVPCDCKTGSVAAPSNQFSRELYNRTELHVSIVIMISLITFITGGLLVSVCWCVHWRLDVRRNMLAVPTVDPGIVSNPYNNYMVKSTYAKDGNSHSMQIENL